MLSSRGKSRVIERIYQMIFRNSLIFCKFERLEEHLIDMQGTCGIITSAMLMKWMYIKKGRVESAEFFVRCHLATADA